MKYSTQTLIWLVFVVSAFLGGWFNGANATKSNLQDQILGLDARMDNQVEFNSYLHKRIDDQDDNEVKDHTAWIQQLQVLIWDHERRLTRIE